MREKENSIWGSTKVPSQVKITVNVTKKGTKFQATNFHGEQIANVGAMNSRDAYVTFPLRLTRASLTENIQFSVVLEYPDSVKDEVEAALWAWQTFGVSEPAPAEGWARLSVFKLTETLRHDSQQKVFRDQ